MTQLIISFLGFATSILGFMRNQWALFLFPLLLVFERLFYKFNFLGLNIPTISILGLFFFYFSSERRGYDVSIVKWQLNRPIIFLMLISIVSAFHPLFTISTPNYNFIQQIIYLKRWFVHFLLFFIYYQACKNNFEIRKVLLFIAIAYTSECFFATKELLLTQRVRIYGTLGNPNEFGAYLSSFWVINLATIKLYKSNKLLSLFLLIGLILGIFCTIMTLSRGSYIALTFTMLTYLFFKSKKLFFSILICIVICVPIYQKVLPSIIVNRINETFEETDDIESANSIVLQKDSAGARILFWKSGLLMFLDNPLLGVGLHQFRYWLPTYGAKFDLTEQRPSHNMYIKMLSEQGIIGFFIFLWLFFKSFSSGLILLKSNNPFQHILGVSYFVSVMGISVSIMFGDRFFFGAIVGTYFILSGIVWSSIKQIVPDDQINN